DVETSEVEFIQETKGRVKNLLLMGKSKEAVDDMDVLVASHPDEAWLKDLLKEARGQWVAQTKAEIEKLRSEGKLEEAQRLAEGTLSVYQDDADLRTLAQQIRTTLTEQRREAEARRRKALVDKIIRDVRGVLRPWVLVALAVLIVAVLVWYFWPSARP